MIQSKPEETPRKAAETYASDGLVRHYRKIGAPAVAAALNAGKQSFKGVTSDEARREGRDAAAPVSFFDHHAA
jgi:hypothetical protein